MGASSTDARRDPDRVVVEERFPLMATTPETGTRTAAYNPFRRRLQAPLREFLGVHPAQAALRAQQKDWTRLLPRSSC